MSNVSNEEKKYIILVEDTMGKYKNSNSGKLWKVKMSNNPDISIIIPRKKALKLVNNKTEYVIENFGAIYRFTPNERLVNIKYKGFKKQEVSNADNIQYLINIRRNKNFKKFKTGN